MRRNWWNVVGTKCSFGGLSWEFAMTHEPYILATLDYTSFQNICALSHYLHHFNVLLLCSNFYKCHLFSLAWYLPPPKWTWWLLILYEALYTILSYVYHLIDICSHVCPSAKLYTHGLLKELKFNSINITYYCNYWQNWMELRLHQLTRQSKKWSFMIWSLYITLWILFMN